MSSLDGKRLQITPKDYISADNSNYGFEFEEPSYVENEGTGIEERMNQMNGWEKASAHLSRAGDYMRITKNPDLKKAFDEKREYLNEKVAELEIASGLEKEEILRAYSGMSENPGLALEKIKEVVEVSPDHARGKGLAGFVSWIKKERYSDPKRTASIASALIILVALEGEAFFSNEAENDIEENIPAGEGGSENDPEKDITVEEKEILPKITKKEEIALIKSLFDIKLYAHYPSSIIIDSPKGFPEDIYEIFNKLKKTDGYAVKPFIDLLKENSGKFELGELERLDDYLSHEFTRNFSSEKNNHT
ncbi:MAG: hypothetical protein RBS86_03150 [Candidatus Moranbacteria bacterium]|jgi:hypothetical protein|nr:hypothetical protein [Candidatus Moranbacteria bacterium]